MASLEIKDANGKTTKSVALPGEIFEVQVNIPLMHQVVTAQLAAARSGNAHTKTRAEVSGGGRKPYKQKGTGRARQGSIRSPQFAGGGVSHGPRTRDYDERTPKKMKSAALRSALSDRAKDSRIHVITELVTGEKPSTKAALAALANVVKGQKVLVVLTRQDPAAWFSLRNVPGVHTIAFDQVNTYDVIVADDIVFSEAAFDGFLKLNNKEVSA
jgi:large subunit ribosomal protein L4